MLTLLETNNQRLEYQVRVNRLPTRSNPQKQRTGLPCQQWWRCADQPTHAVVDSWKPRQASSCSRATGKQTSWKSRKPLQFQRQLRCSLPSRDQTHSRHNHRNDNNNNNNGTDRGWPLWFGETRRQLDQQNNTRSGRRYRHNSTRHNNNIPVRITEDREKGEWSGGSRTDDERREFGDLNSHGEFGRDTGASTRNFRNTGGRDTESTDTYIRNIYTVAIANYHSPKSSYLGIKNKICLVICC